MEEKKTNEYELSDNEIALNNAWQNFNEYNAETKRHRKNIDEYDVERKEGQKKFELEIVKRKLDCISDIVFEDSDYVGEQIKDILAMFENINKRLLTIENKQKEEKKIKQVKNNEKNK